MAKRQLVPAAGGAGLRLARGEHLRIIDLEAARPAMFCGPTAATGC